MLGLLGLFGAVVAGIVADTLLNPDADHHAEDDHPDHPEAEGDTAVPDQGTMLDYAGPGDAGDPDDATETTPPDSTLAGLAGDMPSSSDDADTPDDPVWAEGTAQDDILDGHGAGDTLSGGQGDDAISGHSGADTLAGDTGDDTLYGGSGRDVLSGGPGRDDLTGGEGNDTLSGGLGHDDLQGQFGNDLLRGGFGNDSLGGGPGRDRIEAGAGNDTADGGDGRDLIRGGGGADDLSGGKGDDTLWGGDPQGTDDHARDFLNGGAGRDELHLGGGDFGNGGEGADIYILDDHDTDLGAAQITDWHPAEDSLVVLYDPAVHPAPALDVVTEHGSPDATIMLDGMPVAHVAGGAGLTTGAITLRAAA